MQLGKPKPSSTEYSTPVKSYSKPERIDMNLYTYAWENLVPYGKYTNKTLEFVFLRDPKYFDWLEKECLLLTWGLLDEKQKPKEQKRNSNKFWSERTKTYWIDLIMVKK